MDNNFDNIISKVTRISVATKLSKANKPYTIMTLHFINGYEHDTFLNKDQVFAVRDAIKTKTEESLFDGENRGSANEVNV